ncbi:unnamed protein product [Dicrocoelium dendriticum]|nr:unnamed protein product [Dicrocoelium dendriticum]
MSRMSATYLIWNRQKPISDASLHDLRIVGHPELDCLCRRLMPCAIFVIASDFSLTYPLVVLSSMRLFSAFVDCRRRTKTAVRAHAKLKTDLDFHADTCCSSHSLTTWMSTNCRSADGIRERIMGHLPFQSRRCTRQ